MEARGSDETLAGGGSLRQAPWGVAAAGGLAVMAALAFGRFSYTMLLPAMRDGLQLTYAAAGLLATANLAGYLAGSLVAGPAAKRFGSRVAATGGLGVLALGLAWTGATQGLLDAGMARALAGAAGAVVYVQALGLIPRWFPETARGLASGLMHAGNGAGLALTGLGLPLLLGAVPQRGWRVAWGALAVATLALVPVAWLWLRPPRHDPAMRAAVAREAHEVSPGELTGSGPSLSAYAAVYALFGVSYVIYVTFFAQALSERGLTVFRAGLAWAIVGMLSVSSGPVWGRLSDRLGRRQALGVLFGLQGIAYVAFLEATTVGILVSVALFGLTAWGVPAIMAAAMGEVGRPEEATAAFGRVTTVMGVGQAAGPLLAGALADFTGSASSGLWLATLAALAGVAWSLAEAKGENKVLLSG